MPRDPADSRFRDGGIAADLGLARAVNPRPAVGVMRPRRGRERLARHQMPPTGKRNGQRDLIELVEPLMALPTVRSVDLQRID